MKSTFYNEARTIEKLCRFIRSSKQLSMGPQCQAFETRFSKQQERRYSVFFNSGSSANLALIQSLLNLKVLKKGDPVGFSAVTWATNVMPLLQLGLRIVPIDVSLENLNITSKTLETALRRNKLKALFATNLLGFCGDLEKIAEICKKNHILLLEDNCESLGSRHQGKALGNFGFASTFSTFVGHHLSTIEGGLVCTDDKPLRDMLSMVRSHGWDRNLEKRQKEKLRKKNSIDDFMGKYTFYELAYNLRPTEINGFLGSEQLSFHEETNLKRRLNFEKFERALSQNNDLLPLQVGHMDFISNFAFPVICKDPSLFKKHRQRFEKAGIEIRPIVGGSMVEQPFYRKLDRKEKVESRCPNAKIIQTQGFYFPNRPDLAEKEVETLCRLLA